MEYRRRILQALVPALRGFPQALGVWEDGSAANASTDEFSDIDLNVLAREPAAAVFEKVESALNAVSAVNHVWNEPRSFWPGVTQKAYFLKDAPKHFFVDVAVFPEGSDQIAEFMQIERHGRAIVHFDDTGRLQPAPVDRAALLEKQRKRLAEIVEAFPDYRTEVHKELDRGHPIDAFAFYHSGMVRPLVEVLGMRHRPFRYDFGLRYLGRTFPRDLHGAIERLLYVRDAAELREKAIEVETRFRGAVAEVREWLAAAPAF